MNIMCVGKVLWRLVLLTGSDLQREPIVRVADLTSTVVNNVYTQNPLGRVNERYRDLSSIDERPLSFRVADNPGATIADHELVAHFSTMWMVAVAWATAYGLIFAFSF
jgi:hypothetical protein